MKFGPVQLADAEGAILAHSTRAGGRSLKKGRILLRDDLDALRAESITEVVVARLESGDVHEDPAAEALASLSAGTGVRSGAPFTGRCNLYAEHAGLLQVDRRRLDAANQVDEGITIATLAPHTLVSPKQMLATIKIIPFGIDGDHLAETRTVLESGGAVVRVAPFTRVRAALIQTTLPTTKESVLDKTTKVLTARLARLDGTLIAERRCRHHQNEVAACLRELAVDGVDVVLIAGASAIVDRRDVLPAGVVSAGGRIDHFGMPVDPGNLILLSHIDAIPVLGLPGCARSPKYNGVDRVLERIGAGVAVSPRDIMAMGPGGLLKEIAERPQPRSVEPVPVSVPARAPRIGVVVLAAGQSRRMGTANKLLAEVNGKPMVRHAVEAALGCSADSVHVVVGHQVDAVKAALEGLDVGFVENVAFGEGMSTSVARGIAALPGDLEGAVVCLGDMPRIDAEHLDRLIAAFDTIEGRSICVPTHRGKRGNPVLWAKQFFAEICDLRGDVGARHLIGEHADLVCEVAMPDDGVLTDVDSPEALSALLKATSSALPGRAS